MVDRKTKQTVNSLRAAANKLDLVWKDCKTAHAVGTAGGLASGLISLGATVMTGGAASPLLLATGVGLGLGGAAINLGSSHIETATNSAEVKRAQRLLKETSDCITEVNYHVKSWLNTKETARLVYICCLAKHLKLGPCVMKLLREVMSFCLGSISTITVKTAGMVVTLSNAFFTKVAAKSVEEAGAQVADEVAQVTGAAGTAGTAGQAGAQVADEVAQVTGAAGTAGAAGQAGAQVADEIAQVTGTAGAAGQAGAQVADDVAQVTGAAGQAGGKLGKDVTGKASLATRALVAVNVAFVMYDALDLGFTIRDICANKGSEAAKLLREKANELEATMKE